MTVTFVTVELKLEVLSDGAESGPSLFSEILRKDIDNTCNTYYNIFYEEGRHEIQRGR